MRHHTDISDINGLLESNPLTPAALHPSVETHKPCVLVVDDELSVLRSIKRLLRREPINLITINSPKQALDLFNTNDIDIVISDYRMPEMNGIELLREIRKRHPHTIRITLTGYSDVDAIIGAINDGEVFRFLVKPWDDDALRQHLHDAIELMQQRNFRNRRINLVRDYAQQFRAQRDSILPVFALSRLGQSNYSGLLQSIPVGLILLDPEGMILMANQFAVAALPTLRDDHVGDCASRHFPRQLIDALPNPLNGADAPELLTGTLTDCVDQKTHWRWQKIEPDEQPKGSVIALWKEDEL